MSTGMPELGSKISLISKADIRYEGRLFTVDPQECTIALASVRSFGTEDRESAFPVPPQSQVYDYILFRGSDIKDIRVLNSVATLPNDPAIMQLSVPPSMQHHHHAHAHQPPHHHHAVHAQHQPQVSPFGAVPSSQHPLLGSGAPFASGTSGYALDVGAGMRSGSAASSSRGGVAGAGRPTNVLDFINNAGGAHSRSNTPISQGSRKSPTADQSTQAGGNNQHHRAGGTRERRESSGGGRTNNRQVQQPQQPIQPPRYKDGSGGGGGNNRRDSRGAGGDNNQQQEYRQSNRQQPNNRQPQNYNRNQQQQPQQGGWMNQHRGGNHQQQQQQNQHHQQQQLPLQHQQLNQNQQRQRGRPRGGGGPGTGNFRGPQQQGGGPGQQQQQHAGQKQPGGKTLKFENDYDFEQANTEFEELRNQLSKAKLDDSKENGESGITAGGVGGSGSNATTDMKNGAEPLLSGGGLNATTAAVDSGNETGAGENEVDDESTATDATSISSFYDKTKSFFDNISCEAVERSKGRSQRTDWRTERKLNTETFGVSASRRGGFRGRGGYRAGMSGYHNRMGGGGGGYYHQRNNTGGYRHNNMGGGNGQPQQNNHRRSHNGNTAVASSVTSTGTTTTASSATAAGGDNVSRTRSAL